jgi:hypothetical protein
MNSKQKQVLIVYTLSFYSSRLRFNKFSLFELLGRVKDLIPVTYTAFSSFCRFLPVFAGFYKSFPLSRQKYFLPWQKANPAYS